MTARFPVAVDATLRAAGWQPGRWDMRQAEIWADTLRAHTSPSGHRHRIFPAAVEIWAEFGNLHLAPTAVGRHVAPTALVIDPAYGLHWARTLTDLGRALRTQLAPLGRELSDGDDSSEAGGGHGGALLAIDDEGRVYGLDHSGDYYLGPHFATALTTLLDGLAPTRLTAPAG